MDTTPKFNDEIDVLLVHFPAPLGEEIAEHIGIGYIASILRQDGMKVKILDAVLQQISLKQLLHIICDYFRMCRFRLLGISIYENNYKELGSIISYLRTKGVQAHITIGGHFPTIDAERILNFIPNLDSICRGEGEYSVRNLAKCLKDGKNWNNIPNISYRGKSNKIVSNDIEPIERLDLLPYPSRDTVNYLKMHGAPIGILRSRGCRDKCSFCSISSFYRVCGDNPYRVREVKDVIDEIENIIEKYQYNRIRFLDDSFLSARTEDRNNVLHLAHELIRKNIKIRFNISTRCDSVERELFFLLKQAGLVQVYLGLESWSNGSLERFNKHIDASINLTACNILKGLMIRFHVGFIMFDPYSTLDDIRQNIDGIRKHLDNGVQLHSPQELYRRVRLFRGTPIVDVLEHEDLLIKLSDFRLDYKFRYSNTQKLYEAIKLWRCRIEPTQTIYKRLRMFAQQPFVPSVFVSNIELANRKWLAFQVDQFQNILDEASNNEETSRFILGTEKIFVKNQDCVNEFHNKGLLLLSQIFLNKNCIYNKLLIDRSLLARNLECQGSV